MLKHIGLFEGIGGFSLAARWMGWETIAWCEWDKKCQKLLSKRFPESKQHGNIKETDFTIYRGQCDIVTGGFPCQPYSAAGRRKGKEDERHLWPEMLRAVREIQPSWVVGENVPGLLNWNNGMVLSEIKTDLENSGFEVFPPCILPACGIGAPHRRDRVWIIAYNDKVKGQPIAPNREWKSGQQIKERDEVWSEPLPIMQGGVATNSDSNQRSKGGVYKTEPKKTERYAGPFDALSYERNTWENFPAQSPVCRGNDGVPNRVDRLKQLGNAIVPQVALQIFKAIEEYINQTGHHNVSGER